MTRELLAALLADLAAHRPAVLALPLGGGEPRLLHPLDPGEEAAAPALLAAAREAARADASGKVDVAGAAWFLRVYNPPVRVVIVGAVHLAQALAAMAQRAGYEPIVVDPRRTFATAARFPGIALREEWPDEALARLAPDRRTAVVTLSHDPKLDEPALAAALRSEAFYVGALGSRRTQAARRARLAAQGFAEADLARIHGPVGLSLGAEGPGEIAVAVLAEIVAALRRPGDASSAAPAPDPA